MAWGGGVDAICGYSKSTCRRPLKGTDRKKKREKGKRGGLLRRSVLMLIHDKVAIQSVDASGEQKSELTDLK